MRNRLLCLASFMFAVVGHAQTTPRVMDEVNAVYPKVSLSISTFIDTRNCRSMSSRPRRSLQQGCVSWGTKSARAAVAAEVVTLRELMPASAG